MKTYFNHINKIIVVSCAVIAFICDFDALSDMNWKTGWLEILHLSYLVFGRWLLGVFGIVFAIAVLRNLVVRERFILERRDAIQIAVITILFLLILARHVYPLVVTKMRVSRYYFGPVSVAYIESKGNYGVAADRATGLAGSSRWRFVSDDLNMFAEFLRGKLRLKTELENEISRRMVLQEAPDRREFSEFFEYFRGPMLKTNSPSERMRRVSPEIQFIESLGVVQHLSIGSDKF